MKKCNKECIPACDYCKFYTFNANEQGDYVGDGWCKLHQEQRDPWEACNEFHCFMIITN